MEIYTGSTVREVLQPVALLTHVGLSHAQVLPCSKRYCHDWTTCPFSHPSEYFHRHIPSPLPYYEVFTEQSTLCMQKFYSR